jgi:predicted SprT family Zn-dependent metalloprotease
MSNNDKKTWLSEAKETVACTFAFFDLCFLKNIVSVSFNDRFTSKGGDASWSKKRIRLSSPLWPRMSDKDRYQIIVHEACHIVAFQKHGIYISPHGKEWKQAMRQCGLNPDRCHSVDTTGLRRRMPRYPFTCACQTHMISKIKRNRFFRGIMYRCYHCHTQLFPEPI